MHPLSFLSSSDAFVTISIFNIIPKNPIELAHKAQIVPYNYYCQKYPKLSLKDPLNY